jgi:transcriptional regulator with XRE-family HTH domain
MAKSQIKQKTKEAVAHLKRYQKKHKLSMKELGERLGVSGASASAIVKGERTELRYATIEAIHNLVANGNGQETTALVPVSEVEVLERLNNLVQDSEEQSVKIQLGPLKIELPVSALT